MTYIEREPMIEEMQNLINNVSHNYLYATSIELEVIKGRYEAVIEYIKEQPEADVQPVELKPVKIEEVRYKEPYYEIRNQFCVCPNCGKTFGNIKDIEKLKLSEAYKFCNKCGQGLDWCDVTNFAPTAAQICELTKI